MDGNGRWAVAQGKPRVAGHSRGVDAVRSTLEACGERGVEYLTLFIFSSENWRRPPDEVSTLMKLFVFALQREIDKLIELGVRLRVVGDRSGFESELRRLIVESERRTEHNSKLHLTICADYGGRWDIAQAATRAANAQLESGVDPRRIERVGNRIASGAGVCARARSADTHRRRKAHQQLPAVSAGLYRALFLRRSVAAISTPSSSIARSNGLRAGRGASA